MPEMFTIGHTANKKDMMLTLSQDKVIREVQDDFSLAYPYLKIEFFRTSGGKRMPVKNTLPARAAGLTNTGEIELNDAMTVGELENVFREHFGLSVQVSRKSGILWLETTMTDKWTLKQQNDHGRELSEPRLPPAINGEAV